MTVSENLCTVLHEPTYLLLAIAHRNWQWTSNTDQNISSPKTRSIPTRKSFGQTCTIHIGTKIFLKCCCLTYIISHETCNQSGNNQQTTLSCPPLSNHISYQMQLQEEISPIRYKSVASSSNDSCCDSCKVQKETPCQSINLIQQRLQVDAIIQ